MDPTFENLAEHLRNASVQQREFEDNCRDAVIATMRLIEKKMQRLIAEIAEELGESPGELYFSYVQGKMSAIDSILTRESASGVWSWFKEIRQDEAKWKVFVEEHFTAQNLRKYRAHRIKLLQMSFRQRLSDGARALLDRLEGEFGQKYELTVQELVEFRKLPRERFRESEASFLLPKMRKMLKDQMRAAGLGGEKNGQSEMFIKYVRETRITRPTFDDLTKHTNISTATWKRRFLDPIWVSALLKQLETKQSKKFSKIRATRAMWEEAYNFVDDKLNVINHKRISRKSSPIRDDITREPSEDDLLETYNSEKNRRGGANKRKAIDEQ
jgi:hypothetical protein